jgi:hypothetical protein
MVEATRAAICDFTIGQVAEAPEGVRETNCEDPYTLNTRQYNSGAHATCTPESAFMARLPPEVKYSQITIHAHSERWLRGHLRYRHAHRRPPNPSLSLNLLTLTTRLHPLNLNTH